METNSSRPWLGVDSMGDELPCFGGTVLGSGQVGRGIGSIAYQIQEFKSIMDGGDILKETLR